MAQKIVSMHTTRHVPNDTFVVVLEQDGLPIDQMAFHRQGDVVQIHGRWVTHAEAVTYATTQMKPT